MNMYHEFLYSTTGPVINVYWFLFKYIRLNYLQILFKLFYLFIIFKLFYLFKMWKLFYLFELRQSMEMLFLIL